MFYRIFNIPSVEKGIYPTYKELWMTNWITGHKAHVVTLHQRLFILRKATSIRLVTYDQIGN